VAASYRLKLVLLQEAKQVHSRLLGKASHFIQEDPATVCTLGHFGTKQKARSLAGFLRQITGSATGNRFSPDPDFSSLLEKLQLVNSLWQDHRFSKIQYQ
jgi:hypothetical protein